MTIPSVERVIKRERRLQKIRKDTPELWNVALHPLTFTLLHYKNNWIDWDYIDLVDAIQWNFTFLFFLFFLFFFLFLSFVHKNQTKQIFLEDEDDTDKDGVTSLSSASPLPVHEIYEHIVKSPPEPTRVKSPEQILMRSPDPVNWIVPLDTGKTFTVTQNVIEGICVFFCSIAFEYGWLYRAPMSMKRTRW